MQNKSELIVVQNTLDVVDSSAQGVQKVEKQVSTKINNRGFFGKLKKFGDKNYYNYLLNDSIFYLNTVILLSKSSRVRVSYKYGFYYYFS